MQQYYKYLLVNPTYTKGSSWLKQISHSNSLYTRAIRVITNHVPIKEYNLRFFPRENFSYLYRIYPIELRCHILHKYRRYNNYWNLNRKSLIYFVLFLEYNPEVFSFIKKSLNSSNSVIISL